MSTVNGRLHFDPPLKSSKRLKKSIIHDDIITIDSDSGDILQFTKSDESVESVEFVEFVENPDEKVKVEASHIKRETGDDFKSIQFDIDRECEGECERECECECNYNEVEI